LGAKTVTCDNAHAVKPFGAIDTPAQGGTASGTAYRNHGWVLAPMPNGIPTDGSTIRVIVDGVDLGHPTYNIYRSDIAELFPGYANSNGAAAYFDLNTTAYSNGVHTIAWSAADNAGHSDGIGSRYFSIQNSAQRTAHSEEHRGNPGWSFEYLSKIPFDVLSPVEVIKGFNRNVTPQRYYMGDNRFINVEIKELERVEVRLFPVGAAGLGPLYSGYQVISSQLRPLPIGSTMDMERGIFYWQPGPGFVGGYDFVFIRSQEGKEVIKKIKINIIPKCKVNIDEIGK